MSFLANMLLFFDMAVRERFELSIRLYTVYSLSRRAPSANSDTSPELSILRRRVLE